MENTTVYLIRHAEAEGNVYRRCHGQYDSLLTGRAYGQIEALARRFDGVAIDRVFASDLFRARTTAQGIAESHHLPVETRVGLREIDMGQWEDVMWGDVPRRYPEEYERWSHEPWNCHIPGGETVQQVGERVLGEILALAQENPGKVLVVVSHGTGIRGALCLAKGLPIDHIGRLGWCDNTAVAKLIIDRQERIQVEYINDNSHLSQKLSTFANQKWWKEGDKPLQWNMRFEPAVWPRDEGRLSRYIRGFYQSAYGASVQVETQYVLNRMRQNAEKNPWAVSIGLIEDTPIGMVSLDLLESAQSEVGLAHMFYLEPEYRGKDYAPQLLGQAIALYRQMGKMRLQVRVAEDNARALGFYDKYGFVLVERAEDQWGRHRVLEKEIAPPPRP